MTEAVCFACGEIKIGAFNLCKTCRQRPMSDENLMLSLAMTDHYFDLATLERMGRELRLGNVPELDDETKAGLLPQVQKAKAMLGLNRTSGGTIGLDRTPPQRSTRPWWQFWFRRAKS